MLNLSNNLQSIYAQELAKIIYFSDILQVRNIILKCHNTIIKKGFIDNEKNNNTYNTFSNLIPKCQ